MVFNVSLLELLFILITIFIFLGTDDLVKVARKIGLWFRDFSKSESWQAVQKTVTDLKTLPSVLLQDANLKQDVKIIENEVRAIVLDINKEIVNEVPADDEKQENKKSEEEI